MHRFSFFFIAVFYWAAAQSQHRVKLIVTPGNPGAGDVFVAGSFNGWNPGDSSYHFKTDTLILNLKAGEYAFKFTSGSWQTVEVDAQGKDIENRLLKVSGDMEVSFKLPAFKTGRESKPQQSTACAHVHLLDSAMHLPQLGRYRRIMVHLPPDYTFSNKHYPVLYVHDGQNVFDAARAPFGEWKMDEALDSMYAATGWNPIIVAIDHGADKRLTEYNTHSHPRFGNAEGEAYLKFLTETLKHQIDATYRTIPAQNATWLAGSSMGGVISTAALVRHHDTFGGAGIFSPAYWTSQPLFDQLASTRFEKQAFAYLYAGGKEDSSMVPLAEKMYTLIKKKMGLRAELLIDENGGHNESTWARYFPHFLQYMQKRLQEF